MEKNKRYKFVDWNGIQKGLEDTDSLFEAIKNAINLECEVIDTQTLSGNQIVFSAWDRWNVDWDFYKKDVADFILAEIEERGEVKEKEQIVKKDNRFSSEEMSLLSLSILSLIDSTNGALKLIYDGDIQEILSKKLDTYHNLHNKVCDIWANLSDYKE